MVNINGISIPIEVASTPVARARGLSGRASLTEGSGMFFVFEEEDEWGIWMKEMNFALDIVWADSTGKIITIKKNISPETYPQTFYPATPSKYVLEVPAGFTELHAIAEGDEIIIHANPAL